jgi:hypothetical protein
MLEHKIAQLEERLLNARVIDTADVDTSVVSVGSVVRLRDVDAKETVEYHIVGSAEADVTERRLRVFAAAGLDEERMRKWAVIRCAYLGAGEADARVLRSLVA